MPGISPSTACVTVSPRQSTAIESQCYSTEHDGMTRTFRLYVPIGHAGPKPLVIVLHGGGGAGGGMEWLTRQGFNRIADREGIVVAYPDGQGGGHTWPQGQPYLGEWIVGRVSREMDANQEIWRFFSRHSL